MTPPDRAAAGPRRPAGRCSQLGPVVPAARADGVGEAVEILTGAARADPRPLVRVGGAQGHAGHRRHHRRDGAPVDAGHRLRAVPPRHGRERRRARRVGLRARRHGRAHAGARQRRRATSASRSAATPRWRGSSCSDGARRRRRAGQTATSSTRRVVASNADAHVTFLKLLDPSDPARRLRGRRRAHRLRERLAEDQRRAGASCPNFTRPARARRRARSTAAPSTSAPTRTTSSGPTTTPSTAGRPQDPMLECTIPSVVDRRVAPPGKHLMSMFVQYAPYKLREGTLGRAARRRSPTAASTCSNEYAPNFKRSVIARQVLTPARPGAHLRPHRRQHHPGRDDARAALRPSARCPATPTTARRSGACTCAARRRTPAAASWARPATTRRARSWVSAASVHSAAGARRNADRPRRPETPAERSQPEDPVCTPTPVTPGRVHWGTGRPPFLGPIGAPCSSVRKTEWVGNCGHPSGESSHSSRRP